ncbi:MAG: hypothetical protein P8123_03995 [bacterium]
MTTKEKMLKAVSDLPDNASIEDAMERLLFLAKVERGLQEADSGQTLSHAQVKERIEIHQRAVVEGKMVVKPKGWRKYSLSRLVKGITKNNRHPEYDWPLK